jgi:hypothetical protein
MSIDHLLKINLDTITELVTTYDNETPPGVNTVPWTVEFGLV